MSRTGFHQEEDTSGETIIQLIATRPKPFRRRRLLLFLPSFFPEQPRETYSRTESNTCCANDSTLKRVGRVGIVRYLNGLGLWL